MAIERIIFSIKQDLMIKASELTTQQAGLLLEGRIEDAEAVMDQVRGEVGKVRALNRLSRDFLDQLKEADIEQPAEDYLNRLVTPPVIEAVVYQVESKPAEVSPPSIQPSVETEPAVDPRLSGPEIYLLGQTLFQRDDQVLNELGIKLHPDDRSEIDSMIQRLSSFPEILVETDQKREDLARKLELYLKDKQKVFLANVDNDDAQLLLAFLAKVDSEKKIRELLAPAEVESVIQEPVARILPEETARVEPQSVRYTPLETKILAMLRSLPGVQTISKTDLVRSIWPDESDLNKAGARLSVSLSLLRGKLAQDGEELINTVTPGRRRLGEEAQYLLQEKRPRKS